MLVRDSWIVGKVERSIAQTSPEGVIGVLITNPTPIFEISSGHGRLQQVCAPTLSASKYGQATRATGLPSPVAALEYERFVGVFNRCACFAQRPVGPVADYERAKTIMAISRHKSCPLPHPSVGSVSNF